ncbi:MAG: alpha-hydroxy acid oxidase [Candidatus Dormibacteria bacterium]
MPSWRYLRSLRSSGRASAHGGGRRIDAAETIGDLRALGRRRVPRAVFDYVDGGADDEVTLRAARELFLGVVFHASVLRDVSEVDTSTAVLGQGSALPFGLAPTGFTRMMHHEGEGAVAGAAARHQVPYTLSTVGTMSIEEVARLAPSGRRWFQLDMPRNRAVGEELIARSLAAGCEALMLTVDAPVAGRRLRDLRRGFTVPPRLTARTIVDGLVHPAWTANFLTTEPPTFASIRPWDGSSPDLSELHFDPALTIADVERTRAIWPKRLIVKGVQGLEDARRLADVGVDAIVLSNHGGRQLDRCELPLRMLNEVVRGVGPELEVWLDGGVMSGADVVAALALGARFVLVGRAYLYGLMAGGESGVDRALEILGSEIRRAMQLLGVKAVNELTPAHVSLPSQ